MKVIITGHSKGLGAGMAETLLNSGAEVLGLSRSVNTNLQNRFPNQLTQISVDLSSPDALIAWIDSGALGEFLGNADKVHLLNNAGMVDPIGPAGLLNPQDIARAINLNITATLLMTNAFLAATTNVTERRVMHVSSGAGRKAYGGWSIYCATKAALDLNAAAVAEDALPGLKIASVAPGVIDTDMQVTIRNAPEDRFKLHDQFVELKESGALASAADRGQQMVEFLLSDKFGQTQIVDIRDALS